MTNNNNNEQFDNYEKLTADILSYTKFNFSEYAAPRARYNLYYADFPECKNMDSSDFEDIATHVHEVLAEFINERFPGLTLGLIRFESNKFHNLVEFDIEIEE